jgi:hypothetical protein
MPSAPRRIDFIEGAFCGGLTGLLLFIVVDICLVAADVTLDIDPVAYFLTGVFVSVLSGIVLALVLVRLWNRHHAKTGAGEGDLQRPQQDHGKFQ